MTIILWKRSVYIIELISIIFHKETLSETIFQLKLFKIVFLIKDNSFKVLIESVKKITSDFQIILIILAFP